MNSRFSEGQRVRVVTCTNDDYTGQFPAEYRIYQGDVGYICDIDSASSIEVVLAKIGYRIRLAEEYLESAELRHRKS